VRTCETSCAKFVEDVCVSIPPIVETILFDDAHLALPGWLPSASCDFGAG
jgi:hypothetical protein